MTLNRKEVLAFLAAFILGSFFLVAASFAQTSTDGTGGTSDTTTGTSTTPGLPNTGGGAAALN